MKREYTIEEFSRVVDSIRSAVPDAYIATDIICGFPTENEEQFEDTLRLVEKYKFPSLYISQFYPRPGTPAAKMKRVPTSEVKRRSTAVTNLFHSYTCFDKHKNTVQKVYLRDFKEGKDQGTMIGHTKTYLKVILPRDESLIGGSVWARITGTHKWHVDGVITSPPSSAKWPLAVLACVLAIVLYYISQFLL